MRDWCAGQMASLTGSDDTTLADFLFSLTSDDEVHSYLTMYLGQSKGVDQFAKEFTLRKRAARGTGVSREWQTYARRLGSPHSLDPRPSRRALPSPHPTHWPALMSNA